MGFGRNFADGFGLGARQHFRDVMWRERFGNRLAHSAFVKARRLDDEGEPRRL
jgi:hypothetical protein